MIYIIDFLAYCSGTDADYHAPSCTKLSSVRLRLHVPTGHWSEGLSRRLFKEFIELSENLLTILAFLAILAYLDLLAVRKRLHVLQVGFQDIVLLVLAHLANTVIGAHCTVTTNVVEVTLRS